MYNTKFVQKLAFAYRNCPLSLETAKHFQAYINSLLWFTGRRVNAANYIELRSEKEQAVVSQIARLPSLLVTQRDNYRIL